MIQKAVLWTCTALLFAASCGTAHAHFIWVRLAKSPGGKVQAKAYFAETPAPGSAELVGRIAKSTASLRTADGASHPLQLLQTTTGESGELTASITAPQPLGVEAHCDYGVYKLHGDPVFLKYYARSAQIASARDWEKLDRHPAGQLSIVPEPRGEQLLLTVTWQGKPLPNAPVTVFDPRGKSEKLSTDAAGQVVLAPESTGMYGLLASYTETSAGGENNGEKYTKTGHYATLTLELPERAAWALNGTTEQSAKDLLAKARESRAIWHHFPGFSADVLARVDDRQAQGRVDVDSDGVVTLHLDDYADKAWAQRQLDSVIQHRIPDGSLGDEARFTDQVKTHPLGRRIELTEAAMASEYRIESDVVAQVNRTQGNRRFTISMLDVVRNAEGKYLPSFFTISLWDKNSNALLSTSVVKHDWKRVGAIDLPRNMLEVESGSGIYKVHCLELSNFKLDQRETAKKSASVR